MMRPKSKPSKICKPHFLLMASFTSLSLLSLILILSLSSAAPPSPSSFDAPCRATRYNVLCSATLSSSRLPPNPTAADVIVAAIAASLANVTAAQGKVRAIVAASADSRNRSVAAGNCLETLESARRRSHAASEVFTAGRYGPADVKGARAFLSAAVGGVYACWSGLSYVNDTRQVVETMSFVNGTQLLASNALSLAAALDVYGPQVGKWAPLRTERDKFWEPAGEATGFKPGGLPAGLKPSATVCKGGGGCFATVQAAIDAAPDNSREKHVILIKEGVYEETVSVGFNKTNLVILGEGVDKTVITGKKFVSPGVFTYNTATFAILGDKVIMSGITIENTAGPDAHQAVALRVDADQAIFYRCKFLGHQDTLYANSLRQFYRECEIQGTVDFIFGNSASVFYNCSVLVRPRQKEHGKGENNAVTAQGRVDPSQSTGFAFWNCVVNGTKDYMDLFYGDPKNHKNYLGRPWKEYSRTVFIGTYLGDLISPAGWLEWKGDFALQTLYYAEYGNTGKGADRANRVRWSSEIPAGHINSYSVENFIQGVDWILSDQ